MEKLGSAVSDKHNFTAHRHDAKTLKKPECQLYDIFGENGLNISDIFLYSSLCYTVADIICLVGYFDNSESYVG